jgi:hypothetical protein
VLAGAVFAILVVPRLAQASLITGVPAQGNTVQVIGTVGPIVTIPGSPMGVTVITDCSNSLSPCLIGMINASGIRPPDFVDAVGLDIIMHVQTTLTAQLIGSRVFQGINIPSSIQFLLHTPVNIGFGPKTNMLTINFSPQQGPILHSLEGDLGSPTAVLGIGSDLYDITYSSDFLTFDNSVAPSFRLNFINVYSTDYGLSIGANGLVNPFMGNLSDLSVEGSATFITSTIPEPSTLVLGSLGALGLVGCARRSKGRGKAS